MSVRVMADVFEFSEATGNDRLVLLAIADEVNDDGAGGYPGIDRLAAKARIPRRTVMRCIERLEQLGELAVTRPETRGRGHYNRYRVLVDNPDRKGVKVAPSTSDIGAQRCHSEQEKVRDRAYPRTRPVVPLTRGAPRFLPGTGWVDDIEREDDTA